MHTPIGGISFITNVLIVTMGSIYSFFTGKKNKQPYRMIEGGVPTKQSVSTEVFLRFVAIIIPLIIFSTLSTFTIIAMIHLYEDKDKVTMVDLIEIGVDHSVAGAEVIMEKIETRDKAIEAPHDSAGSIIVQHIIHQERAQNA